MKSDIIIIGAGLFGSMTAKYMKKKGLNVILIDCEQEMAASKCSFGVWKEGWINKTIKTEVAEGLPLLEEFAGIKKEEFFNMDKEILEPMFYVDCRKILNEKYLKETVVSIKNNIVKTNKGEHTSTKAVIVCAGVWTPELLKGYKNVPKVDIAWGATMDYSQNIDSSRYKTWAPYRQSILLKVDEKKFVFGDGATVKNPKTEDPRIEAASTRLVLHAADVIGSSDISKITSVKEGYRPYLAKGFGSMVNQHDSKLFSATGGAKNSTILCGWVAKSLYSLVIGKASKIKQEEVEEEIIEFEDDLPF